MLKRTPNGHLHLALLVALATAFLIALAIPISRTRANTEPSSPAAVRAAEDGLASVLRWQAGTVTWLLANREIIRPARSEYPSELQSTVGPGLIPRRLLAAAAQVAASSTFASHNSPASVVIQRQQPVFFTVHQEGFVSRHVSSQLTVGRALAEVGISLSRRDVSRPSVDSRLAPGVHVYISYASTVRLIMEGKEQILYTHADTVAGLLEEAGIQLEATDDVFPPRADPVRRGMSVSVITIREGNEVVEAPIPFETVYRHEADVLQGQKVLIQAGADGYVRREYYVRKVNGREVKRELISEKMVPPAERVIALGTKVDAAQPAPAAARTAPAPAVQDAGGLDCAGTLNVYATWYTAASAGGYGVTATGTPVYKGIVAVDPAVIPLGTRIYIPGYGYGVGADTGGAVRGNHIDLGYGANDVYDWRTRWVDICILV